MTEMESISMKGAGNVLKVIELNLQDRVYTEMKKIGFSVEALTRQLKKEDYNITAQSIRKFIRKTKKAQQALISKDLQAAEQLKQVTMDYTKTIKGILNEIEEVKNDVKIEKDYTAYNNLVGRLMQGIELIAKLAGELKPKGSVDINIIFQEINTDVEREMKEIKKDVFDNKIIDVEAEIKDEDKRMEEVTKKHYG